MSRASQTAAAAVRPAGLRSARRCHRPGRHACGVRGNNTLPVRGCKGQGELYIPWLIELRNLTRAGHEISALSKKSTC